MDETSRGIATAALTLQSFLLQALIRKGVLTREDALEIADKSLAAAASDQSDASEQEVMEITLACLGDVRGGLAEPITPP
jgi:hypothetical protein